MDIYFYDGTIEKQGGDADGGRERWWWRRGSERTLK